LGTNGNLVIGNYIGTDATGAVDLGNTDSGVKFTNGAQSNLIGGDTPGERNVISGNDDWGVAITGSGTMSNTVSGNFVGTADMGSTGLGNHEGGVLIESGAQNNLIGGNEISGNDGYGVVLFGAGASGNIVTGNLIGLPSGGDETLRNGSTGVYIGDSASNNRIGGEIGEDPYPYGEGNIIVGNNGDGVKITGSGTTHNLVAGNFIGKLPFGPEALGNLGVGVALLDGASENTIGGGETQLNFIGYNHQYGIAIDQEGTDDNLISYNAIGYNQLGGVLVSMGEDNVIGPRNMIVGNGADGVWIVGSDASGNVVTQNGIGENVNDGIDLEGGANGGIVAPSITAQAPGTISGTACSGCTVELFASGDTQGEGWVYLGSAVAAGGVFTVSLIFLPYPYVTATATDTAMGTSEFSVFFTSTLDFAYLPIVSR
jgi:titin